MKAEMNDHIMQNAISQRQIWREQYKITDKNLFSLFSEFTAMMMINRQNINDSHPKSLPSKYKRTEEGNDYLKDLFQVAGKMSIYNQDRSMEKTKAFKLT